MLNLVFFFLLLPQGSSKIFCKPVFVPGKQRCPIFDIKNCPPDIKFYPNDCGVLSEKYRRGCTIFLCPQEGDIAISDVSSSATTETSVQTSAFVETTTIVPGQIITSRSEILIDNSRVDRKPLKMEQTDEAIAVFLETATETMNTVKDSMNTASDKAAEFIQTVVPQMTQSIAQMQEVLIGIGAVLGIAGATYTAYHCGRHITSRCQKSTASIGSENVGNLQRRPHSRLPLVGNLPRRRHSDLAPTLSTATTSTRAATTSTLSISLGDFDNTDGAGPSRITSKPIQSTGSTFDAARSQLDSTESTEPNRPIQKVPPIRPSPTYRLCKSTPATPNGCGGSSSPVKTLRSAIAALQRIAKVDEEDEDENDGTEYESCVSDDEGSDPTFTPKKNFQWTGPSRTSPRFVR